MKSTLQGELLSVMRENPNSTQEDLQAVIDAFREQEDSRKVLRDGEKGKHKESMLAKLAARKNKSKHVSLICYCGQIIDVNDKFDHCFICVVYYRMISKCRMLQLFFHLNPWMDGRC